MKQNMLVFNVAIMNDEDGADGISVEYTFLVYPVLYNSTNPRLFYNDFCAVNQVSKAYLISFPKI